MITIKTIVEITGRYNREDLDLIKPVDSMLHVYLE